MFRKIKRTTTAQLDVRKNDLEFIRTIAIRASNEGRRNEPKVEELRQLLEILQRDIAILKLRYVGTRRRSVLPWYRNDFIFRWPPASNHPAAPNPRDDSGLSSEMQAPANEDHPDSMDSPREAPRAVFNFMYYSVPVSVPGTLAVIASKLASEAQEMLYRSQVFASLVQQKMQESMTLNHQSYGEALPNSIDRPAPRARLSTGRVFLSNESREESYTSDYYDQYHTPDKRSISCYESPSNRSYSRHRELERGRPSDRHGVGSRQRGYSPYDDLYPPYSQRYDCICEHRGTAPHGFPPYDDLFSPYSQKYDCMCEDRSIAPYSRDLIFESNPPKSSARSRESASSTILHPNFSQPSHRHHLYRDSPRYPARSSHEASYLRPLNHENYNYKNVPNTRRLTLNEALTEANNTYGPDAPPDCQKRLGEEISSLLESIRDCRGEVYRLTKDELALLYYFHPQYRDEHPVKQAIQLYWKRFDEVDKEEPGPDLYRIQGSSPLRNR